MNAKQALAMGIVAATLGMGPTVASADPYFGLFWGKGSTDISRSDLNRLAMDYTMNTLGGTAPTGRSDLNDMDSIWGVQVGYQFNRWVSAELGYVDLGKANYVANLTSNFGAGNEQFSVHGRFLTSGPTLAVLGTIPLGDRFEIYGRGGLYFADTRFRRKAIFADGTQESHEQKAGTQELFGGLGASWNINADYSLRLEGTYFLDVGDDDRTGEASIAALAVAIVFR